MPTIEQARAWYSPDDPVHGFEHILRVLALAERLARSTGADLEIVRAAALLHDAGSALDQAQSRQEHEHAAAAFARKILSQERWPEARIQAVVECIASHRFRKAQTPQNLEAQVLFDADKLDAIGAVGVVRALGYAQANGEPAFALPSQQFVETGQRQLGEPHSAYHEFLFKLRHLRDRLYTDAARRLATNRHQIMSDFFEQLTLEMNLEHRASG